MTELRLVDLPLPALLALRDSDVNVAEELIGLAIPDELASQTPIWTFMINRLTGHPEHAGWTMHALVRDDQIIGNAGFKGAPDEDGEVELGYGIETAHRRRGYAVGGVRLLLARAAREPRVFQYPRGDQPGQCRIPGSYRTVRVPARRGANPRATGSPADFPAHTPQ